MSRRLLSKMFSVRGTARSLLPSLKKFLIDILSFVVFVTFDLLDQILCPVFAFLDWHLDKHEVPCYCHQTPPSPQRDSKREQVQGLPSAEVVAECEFWSEPSDTLYARKHKKGRKHVHFLALHRSLSADTTESPKLLKTSCGGRICSEDLSIVPSSGKRPLPAVSESGLETRVSSTDVIAGKGVSENGSIESLVTKARWSDCGCTTCTAWQRNGDLLHVYVDGKDVTGTTGDNGCGDDAENNVIFIHGFLSSSSFWADTVFPLLPDTIRSTHRLFAVDVLGFGKSPKPANCHYSNADHVDMIRRSIIERYKITSYHLVAHSMGCTIALSMAGQDPSAVKSVTLVSPPYYPAMPDSQPSSHLLQKVAPKRIWPVLAFGPSVMSWYEHLGRVVCLVICKNHRFWEPVFAFTCNKVLRLRVPHFFFRDFMQHTHNAAWHIFHNTICSGAYTTEWSMRTLEKAGKRVRLIHGDNDNICPLQCSLDLRQLFSNVALSVVPGANHITIVLGREAAMATALEQEFLRS